jgi:hypothetical protein
MSNSEPGPEPEGPEPELEPATMPEGEPGVIAPEPEMLPEEPDHCAGSRKGEALALRQQRDRDENHIPIVVLFPSGVEGTPRSGVGRDPLRLDRPTERRLDKSPARQPLRVSSSVDKATCVSSEAW